MPYNNEDIFNDEAFEFVIRFENKAIQNLNKQNNGTFDEIKSWITENELQCFFWKKNDDEHIISIPLPENNKQVQLVIKWQAKTFDYKTIINKKTKNIVQEYEEIKTNEFIISENCIVKLIGFNEPYRSPRELEDLYEKICNLEISPKSNIENQQEIWEKWIEAQQLIIEKNSKPIKISGYEQPIKIHEKLFQFKTKLKQKENPEYEKLEEKLKAGPFNISEKFDAEGTILLKWNDIENGIDRVIAKDFHDIFERRQDIGVVISIRPYTLSNKIQKLLKERFIVKQNTEKRTLLVGISNPNPKERQYIIDQLFYEDFKLNRYVGNFVIDWEKNLKLDKEFQKKRNITFDENEKDRRKIKLPEPYQNTFYLSERNFESFHEFYKKILPIFGKQNIKTEIYLEFQTSNNDVLFEAEFSNEFWNNLKREFYNYEFDVAVSEMEQTIAFDFLDFNDLKQKYKKISSLSNFHIVKSPLDDDFKFKVKTELIAKKSIKQEFSDKLKYLAGAEFGIDRGDKFDYKKRFVTIGNLAGRKSGYNNLVFNLPYKWKDEKKQTNKFLTFIEDKPKFNFVIPNLRGDQAKISWLNQAMNKITNPQEGLDTKPVNEKLKDFIFDSSKAEEIFRANVLEENSEEWNELKRHELLTLNNSQRKAILSAIYSSDLALLQGPPGTGKTTVIAEMIWQMIRISQEQKILLTSETNLAVDNALEKLLNKNHTLVKPIRFGRASKFEEEGKKYAFERIMKWIDENVEVDDLYENELKEEADIEEEIIYEDYNNNSVQLWMRRIADNSQQTNPKYAEIMKNWAFEMAQPGKEMKVLFKDKYFKYANVIGSTSSSAGSPNFGADYQRIFNKDADVEDIGQQYKWYVRSKENNDVISAIKGETNKERIVEAFVKKGTDLKIAEKLAKSFEKYGSLINNKTSAILKPIEFDTVITDEASKATPPELLLPMCFGKRNIIIGDHRQLPPMLHDKTFKETLETLETDQAKELASEIDKDFVDTSQFERLITNPKVSKTIISSFKEQYRMHPKINNVIKQFYLDEGGLNPGKPILENADDTNLGNPFSRHHGFTLNNFINHDIHTIWINVDEPEELSGTSRINTNEVEAVELVLELLKKSNGFDNYMKHWDSLKDENKKNEEKEIGIISFYGHQVGKLKDVARYSRTKLNIPVRLNTVDKFQGMERNIIIVSTVRSNKKIENGQVRKNYDIGFAKSPQRLNVALSRAKRLLIIVGNKNFFSQYKNKEGKRIYRNVVDIVQNEGLVIDYKQLKKNFSNDK